MRILAPLILFLAPVSAFAECPTAQDMGKGVTITYNDGVIETYSDRGNGLVRLLISTQDGPYSEIMLEKGYALVGNVEIAGGHVDESTRLTGVFPTDNPLPDPAPNIRWGGSVTLSDSSGTWPEGQSHSFRGLDTIDIGGCTYDTFEIEIRYKNENNTVERFQYLPEFGFSYMVYWADQGEAPSVVHAVEISGKG